MNEQRAVRLDRKTKIGRVGFTTISGSMEFNILEDASTKKETVKTVEENKVVDSGVVNMEVEGSIISADDVMRAGGFGARDDISSFLPVASDSTDFEASLRDARDYEEPQKDVCRPGLGWKEDVKQKD